MNKYGRDIADHDEAQEFFNQLRADYDCSKQRFERQLAWQKKYYNFKKLLDSYTKRQMKKAPHGYKNSVHYLKYYVLPYFLDVKPNNNINNWYLDFQNFRDWLEEDAMLIRDPKKNISYSSKNHAVKSLNTFMRHLNKEGIVGELHLCEAFDESKLNVRTIDDVISEDEAELVFNKLVSMGHSNEAEYFLMLYWTGMRFNEGIGISLADIYKHEISRESFKNLLRRNLIFYKGNDNIPEEYLYRYFGFFTLSSQPDNSTGKTINRDKRNVVKRKPLKMKKLISEKNTRIIPIVNERLWKTLKSRAKTAFKDWKSRRLNTADKASYLLFHDINQATSTKRLKAAFNALNIKYRPWHCCRHSRGTYLHGKTGDRELGMKWLGHSSEKVYDKYVHTYEGMMREIKAMDEDWEDE